MCWPLHKRETTFSGGGITGQSRLVNCVRVNLHHSAQLSHKAANGCLSWLGLLRNNQQCSYAKVYGLTRIIVQC